MRCVLPTFDLLTDDQIDRINKSSYLVKHRKDEVIYRQDTPISYINYINKGLVKIYNESNIEKVVILQIASSGSFLGALNGFYGDRYQYSAASIEYSEVIYTNLNTFREIIGENGKYALQLLNIVSHEGINLLHKIVHVSQKQVTGRLAEALLFFSTKIYKSSSFTLPVNRTELAEIISSSKESVSRTLTEFRNDKIIELDDRDIIIKSPDLLEVLSRLG